MCDEDRQALHQWFKEHKGYGTYHNYSPYKESDEYVINHSDIDDFCDFLRENMTDLAGIDCMITTTGIGFTRIELDNATYY